MESLDTILAMLESAAASSGIEIWLKTILLSLFGILSVVSAYYKIFLKKKADEEKAKAEAEKDKNQATTDNATTENQMNTDKDSIMNQLKGLKNDTK